MAQQPQGSWRGDSGQPQKPLGPAGWRGGPQETPSAGLRRPLILGGLGLFGISLIAAVVYFILLVQRPVQPGLLVIAANPAGAADQLAIPYDPAGWTTANKLLEWATRHSQTNADDRALAPILDRPVWADDEDGLSTIVAKSNFDPVILYFGLPGAVDAAGDPILMTGREKPSRSIKLETLLDQLQQKLPDRRTLVILDVERGPTDHWQGQLRPGFVRAVQEKLAAKIEANPRLCVLTAAGPDQGAWNDAPTGLTMLGKALLQSLNGKATPASMNSYTVGDLLQSVQQQCRDDSSNYRPTIQDPLAIPAVDQWTTERQTTFAKKKFFQPKRVDDDPTPAQKAPWTEDGFLPLRKQAELSAAAPAPWVYRPVLWRQYQELSRRYERSVLAGDAEGRRTLADTLSKLAKTLETPAIPLLPSLRYSASLSAVQAPAPGAERLLRDLQRGSSDPSTDLVPWAETIGKLAPARETRPTELMTLAMLADFSQTITKQPLPATGWQAAVQARIATESLWAGTARVKGYLYPEVRLPLVRQGLDSADADRRAAEDLLLALSPNRDFLKESLAGFERSQKQSQTGQTLSAELVLPLQL
ncbi:MAG: hypothetical protein ACRCZF_05115, partial [Gemmataceae bacterium]